MQRLEAGRCSTGPVRNDSVDGARTASGSMKGRAKWLSLEQPFEGSAVHGKVYHRFVCYDVGLDLAKHIFQVHGVDASGRVVVTKAMRRQQTAGAFCFAARLSCGA
jgi:hypothetical protein